jgi:cobalt/nickel transport system permease protein
MHIEIGIVEPLRTNAAHAAAAGLMATQAKHLLRPFVLAKTLLAGVVFSILMQIWHQPVGPSELHIIGATSVYLIFGFVPSMLGFGLGLFFQALLFEQRDLLHWGVNSLSLMLPLVAMHATFGKRLSGNLGERFTLGRVFRLDAIYYAGVVAMVGFWLMISNQDAPFADWVRWAAYYMPVFAAEAVMTFCTVKLLALAGERPSIVNLTNVGRLHIA